VCRTAERAYHQLDDDGREIARAVLLRLVRLGQDTGDARRRVGHAELLAQSTDPAAVRPVVDVLIQARLLTTDGVTVEIVHEALLDAWPRLRGWIEADRAGILADEALLAAAQAWDRDGRHDADLYRGPRLAITQSRQATTGAEPAPVVAEFLLAALRLQQAEQDAVAARGRRLRGLVAALVVLLVLALAATGLAVAGQYQLRRDAAGVVSRALAGTAIALQTADPSTGAQLALVAQDLAPTPEATGAVLSGELAHVPQPRRAVGVATGQDRRAGLERHRVHEARACATQVPTAALAR